MDTRERPVVVVGAGLAGLACALRLHRHGRPVLLVESGDAVGGRVRSDVVAGFTIDRGFQVINTAYPALRAYDVTTLPLRPLRRGVRLHAQGRLHDLRHPLEAPWGAVRGLVGAPLGPAEKLALGRHAARLLSTRPVALARRIDASSVTAWRDELPPAVVDRVLTPFFSGVVLERDVTTSRVFTDLMTRAFLTGRSVLPARGMQMLPDHLAAQLPPGCVRLGSPVAAVTDTAVRLEDGTTLDASAVVVATDPWTAHRLVPELGEPPAARGVTTYFHAAPRWRSGTALLAVDADTPGFANAVVLTRSVPDYSADGRDLIATSVLHDDHGDAEFTAEQAAERAATLHGTTAHAWEPIATRRIPDALPAMLAPHPMRRPVGPLGVGVHVAGDHRDTSSIQGALVSGRRSADAILAAHHRDRTDDKDA